MKNVARGIIFGLIFAAAPFATAGVGLQFSALNCVASNGVKLSLSPLKTEKPIIHTQFGFFTKDFVAIVGGNRDGAEVAEALPIDLIGETGKTEYTLYLPIDVNAKEMQTVNGTLAQVNTLVEEGESLIAYVACAAKLTQP